VAKLEKEALNEARDSCCFSSLYSLPGPLKKEVSSIDANHREIVLSK